MRCGMLAVGEHLADTHARSPVYRDDVAVGGMIARAQCFSAVEHISDSFVGDLEDGILGMAYQSISELNEPPFFATVSARPIRARRSLLMLSQLMAQKKVNAPMFAFRLAKKGSELYLGGANPAKYVDQPHSRPQR